MYAWRVGIIRKTINGGVDCDTQLDLHDSLQTIISLFFANENYGWFVGTDHNFISNFILHTTNGGEEWISQLNNEDPFSTLAYIFFVDENYGWAVGGSGTILKITNGGVSFVEEEAIDEMPIEFGLTQNFPNPFNPTTTIKYQIADLPAGRQGLSFVTLKVYDVLGNEIVTLVNEEKPAGEFEVRFDGTKLSSGVYFFKLQAGDFVETKKMVLLK